MPQPAPPNSQYVPQAASRGMDEAYPLLLPKTIPQGSTKPPLNPGFSMGTHMVPGWGTLVQAVPTVPQSPSSLVVGGQMGRLWGGCG